MLFDAIIHFPHIYIPQNKMYTKKVQTEIFKPAFPQHDKLPTAIYYHVSIIKTQQKELESS